MEWIPCSNVGHIYREFNRFDQDNQLSGVNIGQVLDRNDRRVAEVWMDEYKSIFNYFRHLEHYDYGNVDQRREVRTKNQCKSFKWYMENVAYDLYVPDINPKLHGQLASPDKTVCMDNKEQENGQMETAPCLNRATQHWLITKDNYIQMNSFVKHAIMCLRVDVVSQVACSQATRWHREGSLLQLNHKRDFCLARTDDLQLKIQPCDASNEMQFWVLGEDGSLSDTEQAQCMDNMQLKTGPPGLYGCHGGGTQQWTLSEDGLLAAKLMPNTCISMFFSPANGECMKSDTTYQWRYKTKMLQSRFEPSMCLTRKSKEPGPLVLETCNVSNEFQHWVFTSNSGIAYADE